MRFIQRELNIHLEIADSLLDQLYEYGLRHYPREFGGILVGHYSDDNTKCIVDVTILPTTFKSSVDGFVRGNTGLEEQLIRYYNDFPRKIYLGEWHTHPNAKPTPSKIDLKAMREIENSDSVKISSPILIILGINQNTYSVGAYVQHFKKLYEYEKI